MYKHQRKIYLFEKDNEKLYSLRQVEYYRSSLIKSTKKQGANMLSFLFHKSNYDADKRSGEETIYRKKKRKKSLTYRKDY